MELTTIYLIIVSIICLVLIVALLILALNRNKNDELKEYLNKDFLNFSKAMNESLFHYNEATNQKLNILEKQMSDNINETNKQSIQYFNAMNEKMVKIDETQKGLNELSNNIVSLESILNDKKSRGTFGEIELYSLLEAAYGTNLERYQKQYTLSNGLKADAVLFGTETMPKIVVDSKFPLENYRRMVDITLSNIEKDKAKTSFKNDVLKHIKDIKEKYIIDGETADFAYMFIPSESIFAEIYGSFHEIVDKSYESHVYIVSPTTLMAYITAIRSIYLGQKKNEKAMEIKELLSELSIEFTRLKERQEMLQRDFEKIVPDFEQMFISSNKIIKKFAKLNAGDVDERND